MRSILILSLALLVAVLPASQCSSMWEVSNSGNWPKSWPAELEPLRSQSRTLYHNVYTMYHIPFTDQAQFTAAWPHILSVATDDSPLTLTRGHDRWTAVKFDAGVVIFAPNTGQLLPLADKNSCAYPPGSESKIPGGKFLRVGPPWPDELKDKSGGLPEHVITDGEEWRPITDQKTWDEPRSRLRAKRARTEIRLVVDGKIVDLNRIQLPASIIDKRFEAKPGK